MPGSSGPPPPRSATRAGAWHAVPPPSSPTRSSARASAAGSADHEDKEPEMSLSKFSTSSPIAVALDLYVADVRLIVSDRADTTVDVRPNNPDKAADVK